MDKNLDLAKKGIEKYKKIMINVQKTDISQDKEFQHLFNSFYQVRRNSEWRKVFYTFLENSKNKNLTIDEVLLFLYNNTNRHSVELSFSSKLLHTINPNMPIYDKNVAQKIGLNSIKPYWDTEKKISVAISIYNELINWYKTEKSLKYLQKFNILFPNHDIISNKKKLILYYGEIYFNDIKVQIDLRTFRQKKRKGFEQERIEKVP